ncbi:MAG TPA: PhzF family phenazine biosynthesis protein [Steroidobacteraceae bacterium]|jgi:trans-2,3-dihydro-3-hydroxyanthranilate isomerase|nr:PhzF family phenazine biosynthesis protein [Steroidobacteraceae bacterium]
MATFSYRIVNVFTQGRAPLTGNPLCVFERAQALDAERMQALALQFNLSETTFILPSERASAAVRIFTPRYEMPFAGHPTLGTAQVCRALGLGGDRLTLEMPAGIIPVHAAGDRWTLQAKAPSWREVSEPRLTLAAMLGLEERDLAERPLWVNAGVEQLIVPLASEAAVRRVNVRADLLGALRSVADQSQVYLFAPAGSGLLSRFFFPQGRSVLEDPATGSATANLGGWCLAMGRTLPCEFEISQGEYAGRPSALRLRVDEERRVLVSGDVIELGRGSVTL